MLRRKGNIGRVKAVATVEGVLVADAELTFALTDVDDDDSENWPRQPRRQS